MDRLSFHGPLRARRERFFALHVPLTITTIEHDILFKYLNLPRQLVAANRNANCNLQDQQHLALQR